MMDQQDSDRLRRLETKITRLALALGIDPAAPDRVRILRQGEKAQIEIQDMSPSFGALRAACGAAGLQYGDYQVVIGGKHLGWFAFGL